VRVHRLFVKRFLNAIFVMVAAVAYGAPTLPKGAVMWLSAEGMPEGAVARWEDRSGIGNHILQKSKAHQPMVVSDAIGKQPGVRFGGDDFLQRKVLKGFSKADQPFHVIMVMRGGMDGRSPNQRLIDFFSSEEKFRGFWAGYQANGRNRLGIAHGDEGQGATHVWDGQPHVLEMVYHGRQRWELFVDGELDGAGTYAAKPFLGFSGPVAVTLGQHFNYRGENTYLRGDLAEVMVFNRSLSNAEQRSLGLRLAAKYDVQIIHNTPVLGPTGLIKPNDRAHWAWQPPRMPPVPKVKGKTQTPVDAFVLSRAEPTGFSLAPHAAGTVLARRLALDLTGLPPSLEELARFEREFAADASKAIEAYVDRLLGSPRFGERWGRHWLDPVGYVDILGLDNDAGTIKVAPGKWRYRDWVIAALNADKPFDEFLTEQLAGDELVDWRNAKVYSPQLRDMLIATGFLRVAADNTDSPELRTPEKFHEVLQITTEIFASNILGLTWQCAKCHDHKLDPIPQADYYRLQAFFSPAFNPRAWLDPRQREQPDVPAPRRAKIDKHNDSLERNLAPLRKKRKEAKDNPEAELKALDAKIAALEKQKQSYGLLQMVYDTGRAPMTRLLTRGNYLRPASLVEPALPEVFAGGKLPPASVPGSTGRRLALARALTKPGTRAAALVARVQVNRIWAHLFGEGLVKTRGNLGPSGAAPANRDLHDWLAAQFIADGWQLKPFIKRLVMSRVYQQSTLPNEQRRANRKKGHSPWWNGMPLRRLESEAIRDTVLAISGQLDLKMGGPPEPHTVQPDGLVTVGGNANRRSVYVLARRHYHPTMLAVFGQPFQSRNCTGRVHAATVMQPLAMFNSAFMHAQAKHFAKVVAKASDDRQSANLAFKRALSRELTGREMKVSLELLAKLKAQYMATDNTPAEARELALRDYCLVVMNMSEFIYVN